MTKKQRCDCTIMPRTATQESQRNGFWKKLCGTWSGIGGKKEPQYYPYVVGQKPKFNLFKSIKSIYLHLKLWIWAATKTKNFHCFEIGLTKIIQIRANYYPSSFEFLLITISFSRPMFYFFEPGHVVEEYCHKHGIPYDVFDAETPF